MEEPRQPRTLVEAAFRARDRITRVTGEPCSMEWRSLPSPSPEPPPTVAVDGGSIRLETETTTIYAVKAWAGVFDPTLSMEEEIANAGPVVPPEYADERISIYREILEAALAARHTPRRGLLLLDGSIRPVLRWWRPGFTRRGMRMGTAINEALRSVEEWAKSGSPLAKAVEGCRSLGAPSCLEELIRSSPIRPASAELAHELGPRVGDWIVLVEVMEKLYLYKEAIEAAWRAGSTPVFITKTSRQRSLCGEGQARPDVYYIKRIHPAEPGYTIAGGGVVVGAYNITGIASGGGDRLGSLYPQQMGIAGFYEERIALVEAYARLAPGAPILLVGVVLPAGDASVYRLEEALSQLQAIPGDGYPAPLFIAHHKAKVQREEARALEGMLMDSRERSMLEF
ncbi:MAG: DNA double-strand break repair nuclease NurA [Desulfurococcales archaeon]|nr:DNA double-strand break repair nuclease NurA [Desulfurococcales archaeon]